MFAAGGGQRVRSRDEVEEMSEKKDEKQGYWAVAYAMR